MVNGAFSAVVRHEDDTLTELKTDPVTGKLFALRLGPRSLDALCDEREGLQETIATVTSEPVPFFEDDWKPAEILPQWGSDPATGKITKYEKPIPNGLLYDLSLPDATVMVVLGKDATGDDTATNLASKASTYLARMDLDMRSGAPTILSLQAGRW